jgi:hypothetical protein
MTTTMNDHRNATHNHIITRPASGGSLMGVFGAFGTVASATSKLHHHFDALRLAIGMLFLKNPFIPLIDYFTRMSYDNDNEWSPRREL